jgi:hypothetical protein
MRLGQAGRVLEALVTQRQNRSRLTFVAGEDLFVGERRS